MNIVIDTNVIISALFFGGLPLKIIEAIFSSKVTAFASPEIVQEYFETYKEIHKKYNSKGNYTALSQILNKVQIIIPNQDVHICRDSDDDKFISCALDAQCLYIVSGDKDLLSIKSYKGIEIVTAAEFLKRIGE